MENGEEELDGEAERLIKQAEELEVSLERLRERFENEVRNICATIELLVVARQDTISKLVRAAEYLDSVWLRCRVRRHQSVGDDHSVRRSAKRWGQV